MCGGAVGRRETKKCVASCFTLFPVSLQPMCVPRRWLDKQYLVNIHGLAQAARGGRRVQPGTHELHMGVTIGMVPHGGTLGQYWKREGHTTNPSS